jgi:hypothetical protein
MRRSFKTLVLSLGSVFLMAGAANAAVSVDLQWSPGGNNTTTITTGFTGRIALNILFTTTEEVETLGYSVNWATGTGLGSPGNVSFSNWTGIGITFNMAMAAVTSFNSLPAPTYLTGGANNCPAGDDCVGGFGGLDSDFGDTNWLAAGTYTIGSLFWDVTAGQVTASTVNFGLIFRAGFDGIGDESGADLSGIVTGLGTSAVLNVVPVPEPTTASLLALGLVGLVVAGRRKQA